VLVSTHYMEEAEYCHRLALMNRGRLIALDTPRRLRESMTQPVLEVNVEDTPRAVAALQGHPIVVEAGLFGRTVHAIVTDAAAARRALPAALGAVGLRAVAVEEVPPSLEDVFIARVREGGGAVEA
jgi:ABC-2 type transport system ATP-binding protein